MIVEDDDDDSSPILTSLNVFTPDIFDVFPLLGNEGLVASLAGMSTTGWAGRDTRSHCLHSAALVTLIVTL